MLDRKESEAVRIRHLDRQILGFTTDEVYDYLMDTSPRSAALDDKLSKGSEPGLAALLYQSPRVDQEEAERRDERQLEILAKMGFKDGSRV